MEIVLSVLFVVVILILLRSMYENTHYEIEYKDIIDSRVKDELKVVFFADLHNTKYGKDNEKLISDIESFNPDVVLIAGDAFVAKKGERNLVAREFLKQIRKKYKIFFAFGNHETRLRSRKKYIYAVECLKSLSNGENMTILNDDKYITSIKGTNLVFMGYEAELKYYEKFNRTKPDGKVLERVVGRYQCKEDEISFLLAHNPDFFDAYVEYGADYVFSGHNHGGIVRLPFIGGIISTGLRLFPKYYEGEYVEGKTKMFVTRGLGSHTIRFRLFNMPQIHMFTFKNK